MLRLESEVQSKTTERKIIPNFPAAKIVKKAIPFLHEGHSLYYCDLKTGVIDKVVPSKEHIMYNGKFVPAYNALPGHLYIPSLNEENVLKKLKRTMKNVFNTDVKES